MPVVGALAGRSCPAFVYVCQPSCFARYGASQGDRVEPVEAFEFVEREKAEHAIATMCRVLGVSPSGYHSWRQRPASRRARADAALSEKIGEIHMNSRWTYGSPRIHAELREEGVRCSRKRVARLMRQAGIEGCHRRRKIRTTLDVRIGAIYSLEQIARDSPELHWPIMELLTGSPGRRRR